MQQSITKSAHRSGILTRGTKHVLSPLDQILDLTEGESFNGNLCSTIQQCGIYEYKMEREAHTEICCVQRCLTSVSAFNFIQGKNS